MTPFERLGAWCDSLPRDRKGLPPCHGCVMHDACTKPVVPLSQEGMDANLEWLGREFERRVEGVA